MSLEESTTREEIAHVVLLERQGRDRGRWEQMREQFLDDSRVALSWFTGTGPDFVTASRRMQAAGDSALHRLGPPVVNVHRDRAVVEVSVTVSMTADLDGRQAHLASDYALLSYVFAHRGYSVRQDLLGDDQGDQLTEFYSDQALWLTPDS